VEGIARGTLGIPEFQRDFDWTENDIRSLLATVFAGWPAGSLLLLEAQNSIFQLRSMESAPPLSQVNYAVLDGQQRLTSLFQALYGAGDVIFAVKWDIPEDQEIEDCIVSYRKRTWNKQYASHSQHLDNRLIPVSVLRSPTDFFLWRDEILAIVQDPDRKEKLRKSLTDLYTYKLSAIHDYEFPVVKLDNEIEPFAISRIFEKVNRTGLTLNAFDLVVAKSFDPGWNLRDRWIAAREKHPGLSGFFGDDGLPLLQTISLLRHGDLRQSAVLALTKQEVQGTWDEVAAASARVVQFLRTRCGVIRRDFMPYANLLPPFIALETEGRLSASPKLFETWFWYSGFAGSYDAAANTRLVSHYKAVASGNETGFKANDTRPVIFAAATRKSQKALWNTISCATVFQMENRVQRSLPDELIAELDVSTLFSVEEVELGDRLTPEDYEPDVEYRGALNSFLVPRRIAAVTRKVGAEPSVEICKRSEFKEFATAQLPEAARGNLASWPTYRAAKAEWLLEFMRQHDLNGFQVHLPDPALELTEVVEM
jgi:hypothetical protein